MENKGGKTLFWSVIMSAPGPLLLGIGLLMGKSSTQIADFVRRSIELLAIITSFAAYLIMAKKQPDPQQKKRIERNTNLFVGISMILAGVIMLCIALFSRSGEQGNVLMGLIIAALGLTANSIFWRRYKRLSRIEHNAILAVQSKLYRAKTFVDLCVTIALLSVLLVPGSGLSYGLDLAGSVIVSLYLAYSGVRVILDRSDGKREEAEVL